MVAPHNSLDLVRTADQENQVGSAGSDPSQPYKPSPDEDFMMGGRRIPEAEAPLLSELAQSEGSTAASESEAKPEKGKKQSLVRRGLGAAGGFFFKKKKGKKTWIVAGSTGLVIVAAIIIFLLLSLLKIPGLAADVTAIEFRSLIRQFGTTAERINAEALAYQTAGDDAIGKSLSLREQIQGKYANEDSLLAKMMNLRPSKIAGNIKVADDIRLDYDQSGKILKSISLLDDAGNIVRSVPIREPSALDRIIPGFRLVTQGLTGKDAKLGAQLADLVAAGFKDGEVSRLGLIIRGGAISKAMRLAIGARLIGFDRAAIGRYATMDRATADATALQDSYNRVGATTAPDPKSTIAAENDAVVEAEHGVALATEDLEQVAKPQSLLRKVGGAVRAKLASGPVQEAVKVADPLYLLALTMCTIYEGSMERSDSMINANVIHLSNYFYHTAAIGDQEYNGDNSIGLANALQGTDDQAGDISGSIPYQKASGMIVDTSSQIASPEANGFNEYTLINASFPQDSIGQTVANMINPAGDKVCGLLLHPISVAVVIAAQLALLAATFGGSSTAEAGGEVAARAATEGVIDEATAQVTGRSIAAVIGQKIATQGFWGRAGWFLFKESAKLTGIVVGTDALTYLGQWWVYGNAHLMWTGLEQGEDMANAVGAGGNIVANEHERTLLFGRALTCSEITQNDQLNKVYTAQLNQTRNPIDRYLSTTDPSSLLVRTASMVQAGTHSAFGPSGSLANIFKLPFQAFGSIIGSATGIAAAAVPCAQQNYGNVQFGWSKAEEDLIDSSDSYLPLENQKILDQSGKAKAIAEDYSYCFGYDYNPDGDGSFDPTDPNSDLVLNTTGEGAPEGKNGSIGGLLANGDIVRTADGDVVPDQGNCSPNNLGVHNPKYGDLVFRWRLAGRYDNTLDQLTNLQTVTQ